MRRVRILLYGIFSCWVSLLTSWAEEALSVVEIRELPWHEGVIRYAENGTETGPLILMVHGTPGGWQNFDEFLSDEQLTKRALVISMDRLGWGGSQSGQDVVTELAKQAKAVATVLRAHPERRPAILVGHSLGGTIVAQAVLDYPNLVDGALIVSASLDPAVEKTTWYQAIGRWKIVRWALSEELIAADREIKALPEQLTAMTSRWAAVQTPMIVLQGEKDRLVPIAHAGYLGKMAPSAVLDTIRIPKQGHFVPWERPDAMIDAVKRLLDAMPEPTDLPTATGGSGS